MTATTADTSWSDFLADGRAARVALICLGVWLNAADSLVTTTIMPSIGRQLGGYAFFSWATAAYMVGAILSGATAARLSAMMGLRRAMVAAGLLTAAGCAVSALAPGMLPLVAGRLVQGLGAGWIVGSCYAALGSIFPARHLARIFGMMTAVWGVATVLGPMVGADVNLFVARNPEGPAGDVVIQDKKVSTFLFAGVQGRFDVGGSRIEKSGTVQMGSR